MGFYSLGFILVMGRRMRCLAVNFNFQAARRNGQHCSAALHRGGLWSIAIRSNKWRCRRGKDKGPKDKGLREISMSRQYRIAVIPGDGIGKEVVPEGLR